MHPYYDSELTFDKDSSTSTLSQVDLEYRVVQCLASKASKPSILPSG
jgi:hypothetical protein